MSNRWIIVPSVVVGIAIMFIDSRPSWDDAGITAMALFFSAALLAVLAPNRAWLIGLSVGIWIPAYAIVRQPKLGSAAMFLVLLFPLAGAYLGAGIRRLVSAAG